MSSSNEENIVDTSNTPTNSQIRGVTQGVGLYRVIEATGGRIPISWDPYPGKPVGKVANIFSSEIRTLVRQTILLTCKVKKYILDDIYTTIIERLLVSNFF